MPIQANPASFASQFTGSGTAAAVDVPDGGGGIFRIRSNGRIEVVSGYPNVGQIYAPGTGVYEQILATLMRVPGNSLKIQSVLGSAVVGRVSSAGPTISVPSTSTALVPVGVGMDGQGGAAPAGTSIMSSPWFWPAVILGGAALAGTAFVLWPSFSTKSSTKPKPAPSEG